MAGGVMALPSQMSTKFLSSSHFKISQDEAATQPSLKSVFKQDYPAWGISSRPPASIPPRPAEVLHSDPRYFNEKASETTKAYPPKPLHDDENKATYKKPGGTNFKMDSDLSKFNCFRTTYDSHYTPCTDNNTVHKPAENPMQSFIPQGDPEKAPQPISDYRDRYQGHNKGKPFKAPCMHQGGPSTIVGDNRLQHFDTTHNGTFTGVPLPRIKPFPKPTGTNVPKGDPEEVTRQTIQQQSYPAHDLSLLQSYDKSGVAGNLMRTNFKQADGHNAWNTYLSTMVENYQPQNLEMSLSAPLHHRNHSDFPEGDRDRNRDMERSNMTTNRKQYGAVITPRKNIISGANRRTKSNVWFGEPPLGDQFYATTMDSTFRPINVPPRNTERPDFNTRSCIPVNYYPNEHHAPTTMSDFQNPHQGKMIPNPIAYDHLKKSHIDAPLGGIRQFTTEHLDQYIAKRTEHIPIDSGLLQRSTVPIGTFNNIN